MKSTNELKKEVQKLLGISPRDYSLRRDHGDYSITVKNPKIGLDALREYFKQYESIRYCEYSQEILSGGNTFVSVQYQWDIEGRNELRESVRKDAMSFLSSEENNWGESCWTPWMPDNMREVILEKATKKYGIHKDYAGHIFSTPMRSDDWVRESLKGHE